MKSKLSISKNDKLHDIQREILKVVIDLCEQENITYFTLGGTTLGAVRESGFIDWDDDIDIGMMRVEYDRFIQVAKQKLPVSYFLMHYSTEPNCYTYFAKVMKKGTCFEEEYYSNLDVLKGIYIDIKPIDFIPNSRIMQGIYRYHVCIYEQLFLSKVLTKSSIYTGKNKIFYYCKSLVRIVLHWMLHSVSRDKLFCMLENCVKRYNNRNTLYVSFRGEKKTMGLASYYANTIDFNFDDLILAVPCGYKNLLKNQFGNDYMLPIREESGHAPKIVKYE